jgi:hypothetical protein
MIARLQKLSTQGIQLALAPALRFAEEPLFHQLELAGIRARDRNGAASPIALQNRDLVRMALTSMHSETKSFEWDAPYFHPIPSAVWWRVPNEDGIVVHSLSWAPLLLDYTAVPQHDTSTFDDWTWDGDYVYKNLGNTKRVHLVLDSDEMFMASWSRLDENPRDLTPQRELSRPIIKELIKRQRFKEAFYRGHSDPNKGKAFLLDPLRQHMFFHAARWHAAPLNRSWNRVERRALRTLYSCVAPPTDERVGAALPPRANIPYGVAGTFVRSVVNVVCGFGVAILRVRDVFRHFWIHREAIIPRARQVLHGDREVIRWLTWRARELVYSLAGRVAPGKPPRPNR